MLPRPSRDELRRRMPRLMWGLVLFGVGLAFMVESNLGLGPWEVFHQGISNNTGIPIGTVGIFVGFAVLLGWIPLKERLGVGTLLNVVIIGIVIDLTIWVMPTPETELVKWIALISGLLLNGLASGLYIGAGLGPGPRDGLMTGIARRGYPVGVVRFGLEVAVLALGWLLGGTVGIGTVLYAFGIGPLVHVFLDLFSLEPIPEAASSSP
ncbi:MAG: hypothetical protein HKN93_04915 [Acidimicrobiia bacterium]|nr:hypothetical protein [Acidimicrobiia bacterium]